MKRLYFRIFTLLFLIVSCSYSRKDNNKQGNDLSGDLIVFHAGSLSVPFRQIADSFSAKYPRINIQMEAAGSLTCARKISELHRPCDVMASADYNVINKILIPEHASWNIRFASNEMVIAFNETSLYSETINQNSWHDILAREDVFYGRSNPDTDPCGYRTVLVLKLAEKYYRKPGLADEILKKDNEFIRPKETDLIALLESGVIDYFFIYRSVAEQHSFNYIVLPDSINLKKPEYEDFYSEVSVKITGKKPGEFLLQKGEPMVYGLTIPHNAPNKRAALAFVLFLLEKDNGMNIMKDNGQHSVIPSYSKTYMNIPESLRRFSKE